MLALVNAPAITLPKGALFYITAFLVVFYFFFTETQKEPPSGDTVSRKSALE